MTSVDIQDRGRGRGLGPGQARVLQELAAAAEPMTLAQLHERTGLHENTLRGHVHALLAADRVTRVAVRRPGRGRPAWAYAARESEYAALSMALADALAGGGPDEGTDEGVRRGGRAWGQRLRERVAADEQQDPRDRLLVALEHTGFAPEAGGEVGAATIRLRRCPLLDAARRHPDVVCGVHLGLIEGVLGDDDVELAPFAEPGACLVRLL
jgi:predicted ArsR family transcriptional regulator